MCSCNVYLTTFQESVWKKLVHPYLRAMHQLKRAWAKNNDIDGERCVALFYHIVLSYHHWAINRCDWFCSLEKFADSKLRSERSKTWQLLLMLNNYNNNALTLFSTNGVKIIEAVQWLSFLNSWLNNTKTSWWAVSAWMLYVQPWHDRNKWVHCGSSLLHLYTIGLLSPTERFNPLVGYCPS